MIVQREHKQQRGRPCVPLWVGMVHWCLQNIGYPLQTLGSLVDPLFFAGMGLAGS